MTPAESKPTPTNEPKIVLRSLSWDHTSRSDEDRVRNARRYWDGLYGMNTHPNVCFVPAHDEHPWTAASVDGIAIRLTSTQLSGQILLALVELPDNDTSEPTNDEEQS